MNLEKIQAAFMAAGFQWKEHIYNDGKAECSIEFTRDTSPHALSEFPRPKDCVGWGRFDRWWAWAQAYEWLQKQQVKPCPVCVGCYPASVQHTYDAGCLCTK
jgi:hypothetical protein